MISLSLQQVTQLTSSTVRTTSSVRDTTRGRKGDRDEAFPLLSPRGDKYIHKVNTTVMPPSKHILHGIYVMMENITPANSFSMSKT